MITAQYRHIDQLRAFMSSHVIMNTNKSYEIQLLNIYSFLLHGISMNTLAMYITTGDVYSMHP